MNMATHLDRVLFMTPAGALAYIQSHPAGCSHCGVVGWGGDIVVYVLMLQRRRRGVG